MNANKLEVQQNQYRTSPPQVVQSVTTTISACLWLWTRCSPPRQEASPPPGLSRNTTGKVKVHDGHTESQFQHPSERAVSEHVFPDG